MIYTVTLNPALDRTIVVERLLDEDTTRILSETFYAGGKGIDVSRVIHALGGDSVALGFVGGYNGLHLEGLLINAGVMTDFTRISGETRTNIILKEKSRERQSVISAPGPEITAAEVGQLYQHIRHLNDITYLILSGSLPRGVSPNLYAQLILEGRKRDAFVVLDADGHALSESIGYRPTCIKPNVFELSRLIGKTIQSQSEILSACADLHARGIPYVLVSEGKKGMILSSQERRLQAIPPEVEVDSAVGAGDSSVAGFVLAHSQGKDLEECIRLACASGTATARSPGTALCTREEVENVLGHVRVEEL